MSVDKFLNKNSYPKSKQCKWASSPILFSLSIGDIETNLIKDSYQTLVTDDVSLVCQGRTKDEPFANATKVMKNLIAWCRDRNLQVSF